VKTYDSLFITWIKPLDEDVQGYNVYRSKTEQPADWGQPINGKELVQNTYYNDSGLGEGETYYYVVTAVDEVPLESHVSNKASERTYLINEYPQAPKINNPLPDFNITEDTIDDRSIKLLIWFTDINNDRLLFRCEGQDHINVTLDQETGNVVLTPEPNWNGREVLTFHASDGKFNISDQVMITVTPVNDPPGPINIISPNDGIEIKTDTYINFEAECTDPDLPYGDILEFNWSSSISGNLGTGETLNNIYLDKGKHVITLTVMDSEGESVSTTIEISVKDSTDGKTAKDFWEESGFIILGIVIIIVIIVIIIIFLLMKQKKKKTYERTTSEFKFEPKTPTWQKFPNEEMTQEELEDHLLTEEE
jgi:fibronectin type 3 domain-containing protein